MKLLRAKFENFRLLRNLELTFSTDKERNLTVIRAANESGKTTTLTGLQWALYGDSALPGKGIDFRLHPIDWNVKKDGKSMVPITATIEFEVTNYRRVGTTQKEVRHQYRLIRTAFEEVDGSGRRSPSEVRLFELANGGAELIDAPESLIQDELPPELREVFFTDGDRALSFIEADVSQKTKRQRVEDAIRSLLGLSLLDDAIYHVERAAAETNKQAKKSSTSGELHKIATRLEEIDDMRIGLRADLEDAKQQFTAFEQKVAEIDRAIMDALQKGDKEQLKRDLEHAQRKMKQLDIQLESANKEHSAILKSQSVAIDLLGPILPDAYAKLEELRDQGKIPNTTVPVLQDRLARGICICGETLNAHDPQGQHRREHIQKLIDDSQHADGVQKVITVLYFGASQLQSPGNLWTEEYIKIVERRSGLEDLRKQAGMEFRGIEQRLDSLPDTNIQGLRETRRDYNNQRDRFLQKQSTIETQLSGLTREYDQKAEIRDRLLRERKKGARILAELNLSNDVLHVLQSSYNRITTEELVKVSNKMNEMFLEMIGADPEQGAIINRAEISKDFDIIVYGPQDRTLNPDKDLNGASRRALTLAFILALTKVSEVEAPNVIDTPLGMTSGFVKRSILRTAIRESTQLILFLTHDEITGCEDILDGAAGVTCTLTNPAHFPKMLVNAPAVAEPMAVKCNCNHRSKCRVCERRTDAQVALELVS